MTPSLVLLPGMDGTGDMFRPLLDAFGGTLSSVVVSYPSTEPLRYSELVALARESLPTNGPYVLLGESFSGPIAVTLAAEHPDGLTGLILCASFVSNPIPWLRPLRHASQRPFRRHRLFLIPPRSTRMSVAKLRRRELWACRWS